MEFLIHRRDEVERLGELHVRMRDREFGQRRAHAGADFHFRGAAAARHLEAHHRAAVEQRQRAGLGDAVGDFGDFIQAHAPPAGNRKFDAPEFFGRAHVAERAHRLLGRADVDPPAAGFLLHLAQLARHFPGADAERRQPRRVQRDADLARDAADTADRADPAHQQETFGYRVLDEPGKAFLVEPVGGHRVGEDRAAG